MSKPGSGVRGKFSLAALLVVAGLGLSCNTDVTGPEFTQPKIAALYNYIGDTPACDVLGFRMNVSGLSFRRELYPDSTFIALFPTASLFVSLHTEYTSLRDTSTIMYVSTMNVDSYDRAQLTLQLPKIVVYDPAETPPVRVINGVLSNLQPLVPLVPALQVSQETLNVLHFDFDMAKSLQFDSQGQVTENIIPVFTATLVPQSADGSYGTFDNLVGFVTSVSPNPSGSFLGSFRIQTISGTGPVLPISVKPDTSLSGVTDLKSLETGRLIEVRAKVDKDGNIAAEQVEVEERSRVEENRIAYFGTVLPGLIKDGNGNVTQFQMYLRTMEPDRSVELVPDSVITVNLPAGTAFHISPRPENLTPLVFGGTSIYVGQDLLVHGQYTLGDDTTPTVVEASSVYLRPQTHQGSLSNIISVGSDGKSGAFWFSGCSSLLQGAPIMVMTTSVDTAFVNVFGLAEISPQSTLFVRGFPFFVKDATTIRGVSVPAGTVVLFASQVRQAD